MRQEYHRAEPVKIIKPDGSSHVASARDFRQRPTDEPEDHPPEELTPEGAVTQDLLEEWVKRTLVKVMRDGEKLSERTAAASAAIKYMAVKGRLGPVFGEDLDEE
jgi:hypothetical protein